jgi:hypothetical protein
MTAAVRSKRYRNRKKRGERLVDIRLTQEEIEKLAARGYAIGDRASSWPAARALVGQFVGRSRASR